LGRNGLVGGIVGSAADWIKYVLQSSQGRDSFYWISLEMTLFLLLGQANSINAEPIMHWLSIILEVSTFLFVGYLAGVLSSKFDLRPRVERRLLLPESEDEARARYRAAWQEYRRLRILFPLALFGWLPFGAAVFLVFGLFHWNPYIATIIVLAWVPSISIFGWQWTNWQCPRCGQAFKWSGDLFFPRHCHYCNLPMWAESSAK